MTEDNKLFSAGKNAVDGILKFGDAIVKAVKKQTPDTISLRVSDASKKTLAAGETLIEMAQNTEPAKAIAKVVKLAKSEAGKTKSDFMERYEKKLIGKSVKEDND